MSRPIARRARVARRCGWCTPYDSLRKVIAPGQVYLRHVVFDHQPYDRPRSISQCAKCARTCGDGVLIDEREANPR